MCEFTQDNEEDDEGWDPGPEFVNVHDFVAEDGDEPGRCRYYDDARVAGNIGIDCVDQLGTNNDVDRGPAHAGKYVEASDWRKNVSLRDLLFMIEYTVKGCINIGKPGLLTDLNTVIPIPKTGEDHLTQAKARTESGEEGDGSDGEAIDEENGEERVDEAQIKDGDGQCANGEGGDNHVGGQPLSTSHQHFGPFPSFAVR